MELNARICNDPLPYPGHLADVRVLTAEVLVEDVDLAIDLSFADVLLGCVVHDVLDDGNVDHALPGRYPLPSFVGERGVLDQRAVPGVLEIPVEEPAVNLHRSMPTAVVDCAVAAVLGEAAVKRSRRPVEGHLLVERHGDILQAQRVGGDVRMGVQPLFVAVAGGADAGERAHARGRGVAVAVGDGVAGTVCAVEDGWSVRRAAEGFRVSPTTAQQ
ncbi:hypothetical protein ACFU6I_37820 [Streptomyces sp. NPDC057486]|uniref:hypothetical protein n=1 Tax=Streptomyces sp. NPDC057486 TaxID=3346145 RepID=UPI00367FC8AF